MDPNATLKDLASWLEEPDSTTRSEALDECCDELRGWLDRGGFEPTWERFPRATEYFRRDLTGRYR